MNNWSKEQLKEMFGDDVIEQLEFLSGCTKYRSSNDPVIPDGWIVPDEVLKKFAELIVKECMRICKDVEYFDIYDDPEKNGHIRAGAAMCREDIKEHFGVE